jgi:cobalt-zinc-cadmium efflux system outer membrane protein
MDRRVTLLLFLSLLFSGAKASVVSLSLKESEQRFSEHNLEVIAERYNIDIAEAQVVQAKLFENPVVSLEQNVYNRLNGRYFDFGKQGETIVEVEQLIYIAGQRNKRVRLEKINKEMALYQFEEVLRTLRSELKEKFIALYFTRKSQSIYDREIDSLAHLLVVLKEQNEKGNVSLLEKSRIEALLLSLRQERNDIANQVISLQGDMRLLLGISFEPIFDESVLNQIDMDSVPFSELTSLLYERPDLKLAQASVKASEADVRLQRSLAFPEVSVKGTYDKAGNFINDYWAIGLSVSLPIFNRNQGNIRAAKISVAQKAHKEEYARRQAENELFTSYARLEKAIQLYRSSNYGLEKDFALIIKGVNSNFQKRNISLLEFIDYYETYKTTCLQLYQTQKEVLLALEEVNTVTGSHVFNY